MTNDTLYSVNQVAIILKVHPLTIRRYIKEGKLKAVKVVGNIRVPKQSVDNFGEDINPSSFEGKKQKTIERNSVFTKDDPIFRLKARGMSLKRLDF